MRDVEGNESEENRVINWCSREKIKHFTVNAMNRQSLYDAFIFLTSKLNPPPSKSTFPQLSMGRKVSSKDSAG